jgi:hypothetical protein
LGEFRLEALSVALHVLHVTGQALVFIVQLTVPLKLPNLQYGSACHSFSVLERAWSRRAQTLEAQALEARTPARAWRRWSGNRARARRAQWELRNGNRATPLALLGREQRPLLYAPCSIPTAAATKTTYHELVVRAHQEDPFVNLPPSATHARPRVCQIQRDRRTGKTQLSAERVRCRSARKILSGLTPLRL